MYDPADDECIEGAKATLTDLKGGKKLTAKTDGFGDFWFEGLKVGKYSLVVEKEGYHPNNIFTSIDTEKDVNLGDMVMHKKA